MSGARIIPLYGDAAGTLARARRLATRRAGRSGPSADGAEIVTLNAAPAPVEPAEPEGRGLPGLLGDVASFALRRLAGDYTVDDFGFDRDLSERALIPLLAPVYRRWFRVEVNGVEHIPAEGGALLVANHAGGLWALDAVMTAMAAHTEHPGGRFLRMLGADLVFRTPVVCHLARKFGSTVACPADADRLLAAGELVGVWPEGFTGIGKPFGDRYRLQRFGRGGFVQSALRAGVPIIPVSIIGSEEIHPVLANVKTLARVLDLPYFPITPTFPWLGPLGLVPLPSKWYIEFGAPIDTSDFTAEDDDPTAVFEITDRVRETIQHTLYRLLGQRRSVWR